jgi:hypothetical protein
MSKDKDRKHEEDGDHGHGHGSPSFHSFCTLIMNEMGLFWFASTESVSFMSEVVHFKELSSGRRVSLSATSLIVVEINKEEYEEFSRRQGVSVDIIQRFFGSDPGCQET